VCFLKSIQEEKMNIIAHRGFWKVSEERNSSLAFGRAFENGYGVETDVRDILGQLVISHDMPLGNETKFNAFLALYAASGAKSCLAINIKADGLQKPLKALLTKYGVKNYFVFDMSVPDTFGYIQEDVRFFSRISEYEPQDPFYLNSSGVWVDCFHSKWFTTKLISAFLDQGKQVCIVSPELHKRDHLNVWHDLREFETSNIFLCTDFPDAAKEFFDDKNQSNPL